MTYKELAKIELQTPPEIAKIDEIRVPVVKAMAYIKFAIKESNYDDSVDMSSAMVTDATHELVRVDTPEEYLTQAVLSLENAIESCQNHPEYKEKLHTVKTTLENQYI